MSATATSAFLLPLFTTELLDSAFAFWLCSRLLAASAAEGLTFGAPLRLPLPFTTSFFIFSFTFVLV